MRPWIKQRQYVWFVERTKKRNGIDTVYVYGTPVKKKVTVSTGSTTPEELAVGLNPDYDRYITSYDMSFKPSEGSLCYVDVKPELDDDGNLVMDDVGLEPTVLADYVVKRALVTKRGKIARYGIKRRDGSGD